MPAAPAVRTPPRRILQATGVFTLLAIIHTWPLVTGLDHLSHHREDEWLNAWIVSWVAHQAPRDPGRLFDANIFHPHEQALAYNEPLIVPALLGAPLRWLGASPLLLHNVLVLAGLVLTALAMYALIVHWTGDHWSGLAAGAACAFSSALLARLAHLQALHFHALPLAVLALDLLLTRGRARHAAGLAACVVMAALTSGYLAVFTTFALGGGLLARAVLLRGPQIRRALLQLAAAALAALAVLWIALRPYHELGLRRGTGVVDAASISVALQSYLKSGAGPHYALWSEPFWQRAPRAMFPGVVTLGLAGVALAARRRTAPRGVRRMLAAIAVTGVTLSLGALTPVYTAAATVVPPLQGLRAPSRFGVVAIFALAALAGIGVSILRRRLPPRWRTAAPLGLLVLATVDSLHAPIPYRRLDWRPPVYQALRATEPGPLVELPIYPVARLHENARYLLASTTHWRPLVNGFGGFRPGNYDDVVRVIQTFPALPAVAYLQTLGVRNVIVHSADYEPAARARLLRGLARLDERRGVALQAQVGSDFLYRVGGVERTPAGARLLALPWPDLTAVDGPDPFLRASYGLGFALGLQGREQFVAWLEDTGPEARLLLRLPARMSGRFIDAATGEALGAVTVQAHRPTRPPVTVAAPPGRRAVLLHLRIAGAAAP